MAQSTLTGVEKRIVDILLMGKQLTGKADWYPIEHIAMNIRGVKSTTVPAKVVALAARGIVEVKGGKVRLVAPTIRR